jgi:hypothetical protein
MLVFNESTSSRIVRSLVTGRGTFSRLPTFQFDQLKKNLKIRLHRQDSNDDSTFVRQFANIMMEQDRRENVMQHLQKFMMIELETIVEREQFQFVDVVQRLKCAHQLWTDRIVVHIFEFRFLESRRTRTCREGDNAARVYRVVESFQQAIGRRHLIGEKNDAVERMKYLSEDVFDDMEHVLSMIDDAQVHENCQRFEKVRVDHPTEKTRPCVIVVADFRVNERNDRLARRHTRQRLLRDEIRRIDENITNARQRHEQFVEHLFTQFGLFARQRRRFVGRQTKMYNRRSMLRCSTRLYLLISN